MCTTRKKDLETQSWAGAVVTSPLPVRFFDRSGPTLSFFPPPSLCNFFPWRERKNESKERLSSSLTFRLRSLLSDPQNALTARSLWGRPQHRDRCCLVHIDLWSTSATAFSTLCRWQFFSFTAAGNFFSPFFPQRCMTSMENNCREWERERSHYNLAVRLTARRDKLPRSNECTKIRNKSGFGTVCSVCSRLCVRVFVLGQQSFIWWGSKEL